MKVHEVAEARDSNKGKERTMNLRTVLGVVFLAAPVLALAACGQPSTKQAADTVVTHGKIYTVNEQQPWAEAMAVRGGEIVYVGDNAGARDFVGKGTKVEDLGGKFVMPGIISTHEHSIFFAAVSSGLVIEELSHDKNKMLAELKKYLDEHPDGPYMSYGGGYENTVTIHRKEIDAITGPDRPFFMMSKTGHAGWANTKALELAGVTEDSEPIDFFGKDPDGTRNGYVGTAAAAYYMMGVAGLKKDAVVRSAPAILRNIARVGVTHMWEVGQPPGHEGPLFEAIAQLEKEGKLTTRYSVAMMVQRENQLAGAVEGLKKYSKMYHSQFFNVNSLKIHGDGSIEGHTAFLLEPYADDASKIGILSVPEEKSTEAVLEAAKLGFNIHTHAIGDAANRSFLNIFQKVREAGYKDARLTMGHTVLVDDTDLQRFKDYDVTANFYTWECAQPSKLYLEKFGEERYNKLARLGTMRDLGIRLALSADYPSAPLNPFAQMHAAVTRSHVGEREILGAEKEKLTVAQAIRAYTLDAAYTVDADSFSGSLEVGKRADYIVLDRNPFEIPEDDIAETKVLKTVLDGRVVFDRAEEEGKLNVVQVEVTNPNLQSAVDIKNLNLLVGEEMLGPDVCEDVQTYEEDFGPGSAFAPENVKEAFSAIAKEDYLFVAPARAIYWPKDNAYYWIQWTRKDDVAVLWAYDPEAGKAVEILQVRDK